MKNKKAINKPRLLLLIIIFAAVAVGALFYLNIGGVRVSLTADSEADIPIQTTDSNILIVYFTAAENSDVDAISSASVTVVDRVAKGNVRAVADMIHGYTGVDLYSIQFSKWKSVFRNNRNYTAIRTGSKSNFRWIIGTSESCFRSTVRS